MTDKLCPGCPGDPNETCCKPELRVKVWMSKQNASVTTTPAMPELPDAAVLAAAPALATLQAQPAAKCDGNHGGPRCADPECWNDDPQAHPAAEVSDAGIDHIIEAASKSAAEYSCSIERQRAMVRAILALRPQAVPMTDEQRQRVFAAAEHRTLAFDNVSWRDAIVDEVEAHHRITAPAGGEG